MLTTSAAWLGNAFRRYLALVDRWYGTSTPPLLEGEEIILDGVASRARTFWPTRGRLLLTNRRLLYLMFRFPRLSHRNTAALPLIIDLGRVTSVESATLTGLFRGSFIGLPSFRVTVRCGEQHIFQTFGAGTWKREILRRLPGLLEAQAEANACS